jgi:hypothetical protein
MRLCSALASILTTKHCYYLLLISDTSHPEGFHTHLGLHQHILYSGCDDEAPYLLKMRDNISCYAQIIDTYAPCSVGSSRWKNIVNMETQCATTDRKVWIKKILSISDEAFILVCLINYGKRWFAELEIAKKMVRKKFVSLFVSAAANTYLSYFPSNGRRINGLRRTAKTYP